MQREMQDALSRDFGREAIRQKKGQGNRLMDYVSHGMVTKRLNDVDPEWHAEMIERWITETNGALHCLGGIMRLTVGGVTREEAGGPARLTTLADDLKNTYSDCLKRCAMRFGVALSLWESAEENDEDAQPEQPPTPRQTNAPRLVQRAQQAPPPFTADQYRTVIEGEWGNRRAGQPYEEIVASFGRNRSRFTADQYEDAKEELRRIKAWTPEETGAAQ